MASKTKPRPLSYRRAVWFIQPAHKKDLQSLVREALDKLPNIEDTRVPRGEQVLELRHRVKAGATGKIGPVTLLHVAAYTPKDSASLVPIAIGPNDADLSEMAPPANHEFLDGDLMVLIYGNDICICTSNATEAAFYTFVIGILEKIGYLDKDLRFEIQKVANRDALEELVKDGVREVTFDFVAYEASMVAFGNKPRGFSLKEAFNAILGKDSGVDELIEQQGVQGLLTIRADGRVAHGAAQHALAGLARQVVEDDAEGFVIETKGGDRITPSELSIRRTVDIEKNAKTIKHADAWGHLMDFYEFINERKLNEF